jgi:hypothetical protein
MSGSHGRWIVPGLLFAAVFAVHVFSPNATPFDSRWTVYTAHSLLHERNLDLNEFLPGIEQEQFYGIECVKPDGSHRYPIRDASECPDGRLLNHYPVAVPLLAVPWVGALQATLDVLQPRLRTLAARMPTEPRRRFLSADLLGSAMIVEVLLASLCVALASIVMYGIGREFLEQAGAAAVALLFAFATPAWSTASRALWQHGPSMLLVATIMLMLLRDRGRFTLVGAAVALAFYVRPTNAVVVLVVSLYVWIHRRERVAGFLVGAAPVVALFTLLNMLTYGTWMAPYASLRRIGAHDLTLWHPQLGAALLGNLVSPARGLFVYVPLFVLSFWGMRWSLSGAAAQRLHPFLVVLIPLHWWLISSYQDWWGGHGYGPRYFSDMTPVFVYWLIPVVARLRTSPALMAVFVMLTALSVGIHYRGATRWEVMDWSVVPNNVLYHPERIWDWRDPPFLR